MGRKLRTQGRRRRGSHGGKKKECPGFGSYVHLGRVQKMIGNRLAFRFVFYHGWGITDPAAHECADLVKCMSHPNPQRLSIQQRIKKQARLIERHVSPAGAPASPERMAEVVVGAAESGVDDPRPAE